MDVPLPPDGLRRDERGVALPSAVVMLSIVAVAMAALAFVATDREPEAITPAGANPSASPSPAASPSADPTAEPAREEKRKRKPRLVRSEVFVEVYNNTGIKDLAASTAIRADGVGWNIVGTDNWLGTIPATAVYYPPRLERAAEALARDLGIERTEPAVDPMKFDRLTVILTLDFV